MSRGHVFVVHGDLSRLACDDIVVPTDRSLYVSAPWRKIVPKDLRPEHLAVTREAWTEQRCAAVPGRSDAWLVDTGGTGDEGIGWYLRAVRNVLNAISAHRRGTTAARGRELHLVGLPLVGVGQGGANARRGKMIEALLALLEEHAHLGHDIALVLGNARDHSAVQHVRRDHLHHSLSTQERDGAAALAARARSGELALFLGAGVSVSAGLPSWAGLLEGLARRAGLATEEIADLKELPPQDAASLVVESLRPLSLEDALAELLPRDHYGLSHALLAALPVREAVTTNYDSLFEDAWSAVLGHEPAVLPYDSPSSHRPWVLKLHGDLARKDGVVLTRDQYLRFSGTRGALAGVVQGLLMTRHVLFAGFGLADENFLQLADEVRQVRQDTSVVGTALSLLDQPLRRRLWAAQLDYQSFGPVGGRPAAAARRLEIFLDLVAHYAADHSAFLLDDRYAPLLNSDEQALAGMLKNLSTAPNDQSSAAQQVRALLSALGRE